MSRKHLFSPRMAPLAAATALLCAAAGANAQYAYSENQSTSGPVSAIAGPTPGSGNLLSNTLTPSSTVVNDNGYASAGFGNRQTTPAAEQPAINVINIGAPPTVSSAVTQVQGNTVGATTSTKIGIDTTGSASGNTGSRNGAQATVNGNAATSTAMGNSDESTIGIQAPTLTLGSATAAGTSQSSSAAVSATTTLDDLLGIKLLPRTGGSYQNLGLTVDNNQVEASAAGNQSQTGIDIKAGGALTLNSQVLSAVSQTQTANVSADSSAKLLGIGVQFNLLAPASSASQFNVGGNSVKATAQGNAQDNQLQADAASLSASGNTSNQVTAQQSASGAIHAGSRADFLGVQNNAPTSNGNQYTVNGNTVAADANGNAGTNTARAGSSDSPISSISGASFATSNIQGYAGSGITASASAGTLGTSALTSSGDRLMVTGNTIDATAQGSQAANQTQLYGAIVSGSAATVGNTQTQAGAVGASASVDSLGTNASVASSNGSQTVNDNTVQASAQGAKANNLASIDASHSITGSSTTVTSLQTHLSGDVSARATAARIGSDALASVNDTQVINGNTLSASAVSQSASNQAMLSAPVLESSSASVGNTQIHYGGDATATVGGQPGGSAMIGTSSGLFIGGSAVVSGNQATADAGINQAVNSVRLQSGSGISGVTPVGVANVQNSAGNAIARTDVDFGASGARAGGNALVVSDNQAAASASQNQGINTLALQAGSTLNASGSPTFTLASLQSAAGNTSATVNTQLLTGTGTGNSGATTVSGNQASASARANVANNQLTLASTSQTANALAQLNNQQYNTGGATANSAMTIGVAGFGNTGAINVAGNGTSALAAGNAALNAIDASAGVAFNGPGALALLNTQGNSGPVMATVALNALSDGGSSVTNLLNNTASAAAYGNSAVNQLTATALPNQLMASANLTSVQNNTGAVTAMVTGNITSSGTAGSVNISGNRVSALAVGNSSISSMTLGR